MDTDKIVVLCRTSDRIFEKKKKAEELIDHVNEISSVKLNSPYSELVVSFDDYPELRPIAEKILKYVIKSEETKQMEIKMEVAKCL